MRLVGILLVLAGAVAAFVMLQVLASVQPPLSAVSPSVYKAVPEEEFARLAVASFTETLPSGSAEFTESVPAKPKRTAAPKSVSGSLRVSLTWYCLSGVSRCTRGFPGGHYAAASPDLLALGWRGKSVRVCWSGNCTTVRIVDCNCQASRSIDLYSLPFSELADLGRGRLRGATAGILQ